MLPRVSSFESNREPFVMGGQNHSHPNINSSLILNNSGAVVVVKCIPSFVEAIIPAF